MDNRVQIGDKIEAVWCVDSETGQRYLLDILTGQIVATEDQFNGNQGH